MSNSTPFPEFVKLFGEHDEDALVDEVAAGFLLVTRAKSPDGSVNSFETMVGSGIRNPLRRTLKDMMVYPIIKNGPDSAQNIITVGRVSKCDIQLEHQSISRFHAYFQFEPGSRSYTVADAGSLNGTRVNMVRLKKNKPTPVKGGASIMFGKAFGVTFHTAATILDYMEQFRPYV
jgi:hypothetical protein